MSRALQILNKARELVAENWCTGITAQDAKGGKVHNYSPDAAKFPVYAAIDAAFCSPVHCASLEDKYDERWGKAHERAKGVVSAAAKQLRGKKAIVEFISDEGQEQALELLDTTIGMVKSTDAKRSLTALAPKH